MGAATVRKLVKLGAKVVLAARREDQLKNITLGENALYVVTDVSKRADMDNLVIRAIEKFGHIDAFWNNARIM
jgi:NADP-dependent 3-hydroxy acid dehydrogenase YdfG